MERTVTRPAAGRAAALAELTRAECAELGPHALVVWPLGAIEQHGPHLPTGTDTFHVEWVAQRAVDLVARRLPVVLAPTLCFGSSDHHLPFGGTMSLGTGTYLRVLLELGGSLAAGGFRRLFLVNGHGGNHELAQLAARDLALRHEVYVGAGSWWEIAAAALGARAAGEVGEVGEVGAIPGHAGSFETSLVLAMRPELVREPPRRAADPERDRERPAGYRAEHHGWWQSMDGFTDLPDRGEADRGKGYLDAAAAEVAARLVDFFVATGGRVAPA